MTDPAAPQNPYVIPPTAAPPQFNPADERLWSMLIHILSIFFSFLPALIGYLALADRGLFVREHARQALNFQISLAIYSVGVLIVGVITLTIGWVLYLPLGIAALVFMIMAAVAANNGQYYKFPLTITFIR